MSSFLSDFFFFSGGNSNAIVNNFCVSSGIFLWKGCVFFRMSDCCIYVHLSSIVRLAYFQKFTIVVKSGLSLGGKLERFFPISQECWMLLAQWNYDRRITEHISVTSHYSWCFCIPIISCQFFSASEGGYEVELPGSGADINWPLGSSILVNELDL